MAFITILITGIAVIITVLAGAIYIISQLFLGIFNGIKGNIKHRQLIKGIRKTLKQTLNYVDNKIKENDGKIYYEVVSYTNKNNSLKKFVNIYVKDNTDFVNVNKKLSLYLCENQCYPLVKYFGNKKDLKDTIVIADMGQFYIETALSKIAGIPVRMEQLV